MKKTVKLTIEYVIETEALDELEEALANGNQQLLYEIFGVGWEDALSISMGEVGK